MNSKYIAVRSVPRIYLFHVQFFEMHSITKLERSRSNSILKIKQTKINSNIRLHYIQPHPQHTTPAAEIKNVLKR